ncbi:MAG: 3-hydroxyacyl-CoA dehydrogenase family protein [Waddliaceae bacterium]
MRLENVAVLGAGGKMGRGIALLLLQQMAMQKSNCSLHLIDPNEEQLSTLRPYFREHLRPYAEKNIVRLRESSNQIANDDVIKEYIERGIDLVYLHTHLDAAFNSTHIFEAIVEDIEIKAKVLSQVKKLSVVNPLFLSNTSSIPIHLLNQKGNLQGRILGFHFYNPPPVQTLVELVTLEGGSELDEGKQIAKWLGKTVVRSKDVAGFIGNGHFIRELSFANDKLKELPKEIGPLIIDYVTREYLIRPMGLFQLLEYVGYDVGVKICAIMNSQLNEEFTLPPKWEPKEVEGLDEFLGPLPKGHQSWREAKRGIDFASYFKNLLASKENGAKLAVQFLLESRKIAFHLVQQGVAESVEDVNTVLKTGFYHLYGADNPWIPKEQE